MGVFKHKKKRLYTTTALEFIEIVLIITWQISPSL